MGSVTREREGLWAMVIKPGTLSMPEFGQLYCGLKSYPSFRVRYVDGTSNKPAVVILSFSDLPSLARGLEMLEKPAQAEVTNAQGQGKRRARLERCVCREGTNPHPNPTPFAFFLTRKLREGGLLCATEVAHGCVRN